MRFFLFVVMGLFVSLSQIMAAPGYNTHKKAPLLIDNDQGMQCFDDKKMCVAEGNVVVTKGLMVLKCRKLKAFFREVEGRKKIYKVEAFGNVRFTGLQGDRAWASYMQYNMDTHKLTLKRLGKKERLPVVWRNTNALEGEKLVAVLGLKNEIKEVLSFGKTKLDNSAKPMIQKEQSVALLYPKTLKQSKSTHAKSKSR